MFWSFVFAVAVEWKGGEMAKWWNGGVVEWGCGLSVCQSSV